MTSYSEIEIADRFAERFGGRVTFVEGTSWSSDSWWHYDGSKWRPATDERAFNWVRNHCRQQAAAYAATPDAEKRHTRSIASLRMVRAVLQIAQRDERIWVTGQKMLELRRRMGSQ